MGNRPNSHYVIGLKKRSRKIVAPVEQNTKCLIRGMARIEETKDVRITMLVHGRPALPPGATQIELAIW